MGDSTRHLVMRTRLVVVTKRNLRLRSVQSLLLYWVLCLWCGRVLAEPFIPNSDDQVLERLPSKRTAADARELRRKQSGLATDPENLSASLQLARTYIETARAEGDPRYLGYAQATLAPWWGAENPPVEVMVLRATIRQSSHDFQGALVDSEAALDTDPKNVQAWLTKAIVLQVRGEFKQAKKAALHLWSLAPELVTVTCLSGISSLSGEAEKSYTLLSKTLGRNTDADPAERLWATTQLAEMATRLGRTDEAEKWFKDAFALKRRDGYLLGAYADFLLDRGQAQDVIDLLTNETRADGLLLRLVLAEASIVSLRNSLDEHIKSLQERFNASRERGENIHQREEARFALHLLKNNREALRLAQANWSIQREPADARILLESALAAQDFAAAGAVKDWATTNHLEDVRLARLLVKLPSTTAARNP